MQLRGQSSILGAHVMLSPCFDWGDVYMCVAFMLDFPLTF